MCYCQTILLLTNYIFIEMVYILVLNSKVTYCYDHVKNKCFAKEITISISSESPGISVE